MASKCMRAFTCKGGKIVTPPKYAGEACKCSSPDCFYCAVDAARDRETCKSCRNGAYFYDGDCHASCSDVSPALVSLGTGAFKRRCIDNPFACRKGRLVQSVTGAQLDVPFGCKCPNADNTKPDANCHTCEFRAGEAGQQCTVCRNRHYLHQDRCLTSCSTVGLAPYLPSGGAGGLCIAPFVCTEGADEADGVTECSCPRSVGKGGACVSCTMSLDGPQCHRCDRESGRPFLHAGICVSACPGGGESFDGDAVNPTSQFNCTEGQTIRGQADVVQTNGGTANFGVAFKDCARECAAKNACASFVAKGNGYCELWSIAGGTLTETRSSSTHCVKKPVADAVQGLVCKDVP